MRFGAVTAHDALAREWNYSGGVRTGLAFLPCPAALIPGPEMWGVYQEAFRRAAEEVERAQMAARVKEMIPLTPTVGGANNFAVSRNGRA